MKVYEYDMSGKLDPLLRTLDLTQFCLDEFPYNNIIKVFDLQN